MADSGEGCKPKTPITARQEKRQKRQKKWVKEEKKEASAIAKPQYFEDRELTCTVCYDPLTSLTHSLCEFPTHVLCDSCNANLTTRVCPSCKKRDTKKWDSTAYATQVIAADNEEKRNELKPGRQQKAFDFYAKTTDKVKQAESVERAEKAADEAFGAFQLLQIQEDHRQALEAIPTLR
jgi:hypothetical protein